MDSNQLRKAYIDFFQSKQHAVIPPAPLIPTDDPTTLFTSSGMQPLVPFLKGESHPMGARLVNSQPCFRAEDIDQVGDNRHTTFFEMLGNWSLGDYFKPEQLSWFWEFLTQVVHLDPKRLHVTVFKGHHQIQNDQETHQIWRDLGLPEDHIHYYDATKNWWSRAGTPDKMPPGEIGGPDSEVFYDFGPEHNFHQQSPFADQTCHVNCDCGRYLEIGNSVFMQYIKQKDGTFKPLPKQNVDFGGGLERTLAASQDQPDIFQTDIFNKPRTILEEVNLTNTDKSVRNIRVILDHLRGSIFMINESIKPSNKLQGYILRKLIRRSVLHSKLLNIDLDVNLGLVVKEFVSSYSQAFPSLNQKQQEIINTIQEEVSKFNQTLKQGMKKILSHSGSTITGRQAFDYYQTYGFPPELIQEFAQENNIQVNLHGFDKAKEKHQHQSRTASAGMFKGGLADHSETVTKLHTATHLLHTALRQVLGNHIRQEGSNITSKRLRFDFAHPHKLTDQQIQTIESQINHAIKQDLPVTKTIEDRDQALKSGALAFFKETYPDQVSVYTIGDSKHPYSKEFCGGPHVSSTGQIGTVRITKQESIGSGKRRIYAVLS